ncbi:MAG: hypothetical protein HXS54_13785 [Theionarchaea archaeon]|nr:hypothetical protein [Theionarchaea archaeon]
MKMVNDSRTTKNSTIEKEVPRIFNEKDRSSDKEIRIVQQIAIGAAIEKKRKLIFRDFHDFLTNLEEYLPAEKLNNASPIVRRRTRTVACT